MKHNVAIIIAAAALAASAATFEPPRLPETATKYPYGTDHYRITTDPFGVQTIMRRYFGRDREIEETVSAGVTVRTTRIRGGATISEKLWDGKWTRETRSESFTAGGCRIETVVTESSDGPASRTRCAPASPARSTSTKPGTRASPPALFWMSTVTA
jgi:hypothetical protein